MQWPWKKAESELEREMRYHLESLADGFERQDLSREEAMRRARREFGGVEQVKEQCRDERRWQPLAQLAQDLTFGVRMLRKAPAVTAAAVLSLALGIGATTAILSLVDAVLWRTIAVPHPEQLTEILWHAKGRPRGVYQSSSGSMYPDGLPRIVADFFSYRSFHAMRNQGAGRVEVAAHLNADDVSTSYGGATTVARLRPVSGNFFPMLALQPFAGRLLAPADDDAAAPPTLVVSHRYWETVLKGDIKAVGRTVRLNNRLYTVAGVLPPSFGGIATGEATGLYTSIAHSPEVLDPDGWFARKHRDPMTWCFQLLARLAPGESHDSLTPMLDAAFRSTWAGQPEKPELAPSIRLRDASTGLGRVRRDLGNPLSMLFALVALVLLIACANIANLLLARADTRRKEVALRVSLGCGRARLIRQFFTESVLLAAGGGLLSLGVAYATANFAVSLMSKDLRGLSFDIDGRMILATLAVTGLTAVFFGLYPAWRASSVDAAPSLKEGAGSIGGTRHSWLAPGKLLVLAQVALGVLLVAAAATFTGHLRKILNSDTGFERTRLLLFDLRPGQSGYQGARLKQFYFDLEERLRRVPGVEAVGISQVRPMVGGGYWDDVNPPAGKPIGCALNFVTSDYLRALGVAIVSGRGISEQDVRSGAKVAVVSEDLAKAMGGSPVGTSFTLEDKKPIEIIGVAARARYDRLTEQPKVVYLPHPTSKDTLTVVARTAVAPMRVLGSVRAAVRELDRDLPMAGVLTMEEQIGETLRRERLFAWLCGGFGVLALLLCMIGLYGVMSYATARRSQEIGIRMALGATRRDVLRQVVGEGMGVALLGLLVGAPVAWWAARKYVDYKQLGMDPLDPAIIGATVAALAISALCAVLAPAIRAASADPVQALRQG
jgi:predicted permease